MSNGHTKRRTVLKTSAVAVFAGLTGCTGAFTSNSDSGEHHSTRQTEWDFLQYLPNTLLGSDGGFVLTGSAAVRRDQKDLGAKKSSQILRRSVGESGWIPDQEIDNQVIWDAPTGWGYAFETPLTKSDIIARYEESHLREIPVGTYDDYSLFERSSSWHAVSENEVIKIPTRNRGDVESYIDALDHDRTLASDIRLVLNEFDSRYFLDVGFFASSHREFDISDIEHHGRCMAVSPNSDSARYTLTVGIFTDSPARLAEWVREKEYIFIGDRKFSNPTVQISDSFVRLEETGTVASFNGYN